MFIATLPSRNSSSDEDVHGAGLGHRRHVLDQAQVLFERGDSFRRVDDAFGLAVRRLGFIPGVAAHLPDEAVDLHRREVVALAGLIGDSVEIVFGRSAGEHVALLALEELADVLEVIPGHGIELFAGAGQLLAVLRLEVLLLFVVADDVLAGEVHQHVGELREAVVVFRLVGIGRVGVQRIRMNRLEGRHELRIGFEQIVDLAEVAAFNEGAQPLRVRHDEVVLLLARRERRVDAGVEVRPRNEVDVELHGVAGRACTARRRTSS
jgi:hypothetical protein